MKIFSSEFIKAYESYSFGYTQYCISENSLELPEIYGKGFLPYSANPELDHLLFYMARSLRINVSDYRLTSENKRIEKKMEDLRPVMELVKKEDFDLSNPAYEKFCLDYADTRFSNSSMSTARFRHIMGMPLGSHIFRFRNGDENLGYVFSVIKDSFLHYWYAFFNTQYLRSHSLGKYMMSEVIKWADQNELEHVYLGTCYGANSLYKVRDFKGIEYWDGTFWSTDKNLLKSMCKQDHEEKKSDTFKIREDQNAYLDKIINAS